MMTPERQSSSRARARSHPRMGLAASRPSIVSKMHPDECCKTFFLLRPPSRAKSLKRPRLGFTTRVGETGPVLILKATNFFKFKTFRLRLCQQHSRVTTASTRGVNSKVIENATRRKSLDINSG